MLEVEVNLSLQEMPANQSYDEKNSKNYQTSQLVPTGYKNRWIKFTETGIFLFNEQ